MFGCLIFFFLYIVIADFKKSAVLSNPNPASQSPVTLVLSSQGTVEINRIVKAHMEGLFIYKLCEGIEGVEWGGSGKVGHCCGFASPLCSWTGCLGSGSLPSPLN